MRQIIKLILSLTLKVKEGEGSSATDFSITPITTDNGEQNGPIVMEETGHVGEEGVIVVPRPLATIIQSTTTTTTTTKTETATIPKIFVGPEHFALAFEKVKPSVSQKVCIFVFLAKSSNYSTGGMVVRYSPIPARMPI